MNKLKRKMGMIHLKDEALQALREYWYIHGNKTSQAKRLVKGDIDLNEDRDVIC